MRRSPHVLLGIGAARSPARSGPDRGRAQGHRRGPRGDHDDHAQLDRDLHRRSTSSALGGPLQTRQQRARRSRRHRRSAQATRSSGASGLQGLHIGFFIALARAVVFCAILNRTTLGYEVRAVGFNPEAARYGGIVAQASDPRDGDLRARSPASPARRHARLCTASASRTSRSRRSASSASRSRCSAATRPSASCSRRSSSPRSSRHDARPPVEHRSPRSLAGNLTYIIQGLSSSSSAPTC